MVRRKEPKPRICGHCIYFEGGFCWRFEDEPEAKYYNEVACNLGKKNSLVRLKNYVR